MHCYLYYLLYAGRTLKGYDMKHQRVLIALELRLDEDTIRFKNDLVKLTDARNDVKQGFIAHFTREKTIPVDEYQEMKDLLEANSQIGALIIDGSSKTANVYKRRKRDKMSVSHSELVYYFQLQ